jgi:hypothetical protein
VEVLQTSALPLGYGTDALEGWHLRRPATTIGERRHRRYHPRRRRDRAGNRARTGDLNLGKVALYQLSYARNPGSTSAAARMPPISGTTPECRGKTGSTATIQTHARATGVLFAGTRKLAGRSDPVNPARRRGAAVPAGRRVDKRGRRRLVCGALFCSFPARSVPLRNDRLMIRWRTVVGLLLLIGVHLSAGRSMVHAQQARAQVADWGVTSLRVGGAFSIFDSRFGHPLRPAESEREPLANELFVAQVGDERFAPFGTLRTRLNSFFEAVPGSAASVAAGNLFLETNRLEVSADHREVPFELEVGVLPRISIGVRVPLVQHWTSITGFRASGGNVGWNPDPALNRELLASIDTAFALLGGGPFLPTRDSPAGVALRQRVAQAAPGRELLLPEALLTRLGAEGLAGVEQIGLGRHEPARAAWELGDTEVLLSLQLLRPDRGGARTVSVTAAVDAGVRIATGTPPDADYPVLPRPLLGIAGTVAGLRVDAQAARLGAAAAVRVQHLGEVTFEHRFWPSSVPDTLAGAPATTPIRWSPGTQVAFDAMPYFRLVNEIRVLGAYGYERRSETLTILDAAAEAAFGGSAAEGPMVAQRWGAGLEYSTLRRYGAGEADLPFEAGLFFRSAFAGQGGAPADRTVAMYLRLFVRLWGGR